MKKVDIGKISWKLAAVIALAAIYLFSGLSVNSVLAASSLDGRILLQVEAHGEAWYVNPVNSSRYYLGRPDDAFAIMRSLGLGVSNSDLAQFKVDAPARISGRILLQVQDKGQAYYVSPTDLKLYYLGRPADAFEIMRSLGLGITNADLIKIRIASVGGISVAVPTTATPVSTVVNIDTLADFSFKYQNQDYSISTGLSSALYDSYKSSTKIYSYTGVSVPESVLRESFYGLFFNVKAGDNSLDDLLIKLQAVARQNNWTDDETLEFIMALVQYIPYDSAKLSALNNRNNNPYYPYETLYLDKGVCSDKTFLAVAILRKLGYGAAILDFPEANHSAVGIACPTDQSLSGTGYCFGETTNYFPLGVVPPSLSAGQAQTGSEEYDGLFDAGHLGNMEIYQKTGGRLYYGVAATRARVAALKASKDYLNAQAPILTATDNALQVKAAEISALKAQMDEYYNSGQISQYNSLVETYNGLVNAYNDDLNIYRAMITNYNDKAQVYNQEAKNFYQK